MRTAVRIAKAGVYRLNKDQNIWLAVMKKANAGPAYDVVVDNAGTLWAGTWNGILKSTNNGLTWDHVLILNSGAEPIECLIDYTV